MSPLVKNPILFSAALAVLGIPKVLSVDGPFKLCVDQPCESCPVSIDNEGSGYPACVVYNTADVFTDEGFNGTDGGYVIQKLVSLFNNNKNF